MCTRTSVHRVYGLYGMFQCFNVLVSKSRSWKPGRVPLIQLYVSWQFLMKFLCRGHDFDMARPVGPRERRAGRIRHVNGFVDAIDYLTSLSSELGTLFHVYEVRAGDAR